MRITILGGGGFLGRKLAGQFGGRRCARRPSVSGLTLFDIVPPPQRRPRRSR